MEIWKDINGYDGIYQISTFGNLRSRYNNIHGLKKEYNILNPSKDAYGYLCINLCKDKIKKRYLIHKLMAMNFLNHTPNKYTIVIDHINNIKTDNRLENLQLISHRENLSKDKSRNNSKYVGVSKKKNSKKWRSQIYVNGKAEHLGYFINEIDANNAYLKRLKEINV